MNKIITITAAISLLMLSFLSFAEPGEQRMHTPNNTPQWYQVELLVYANDYPRDADQEQWRQDLGLKYPHNIIALNQYALPEIETVANPDDASSENSIGTHNQSPDTADQMDTTLEAQRNLYASDEEQPFTLLDPTQHRLNHIANRIRSSADLRLLFHHAWRQPIRAYEQSENILIRGGDPFDAHFELEGYIKLSIERYLHIDTDLWLSTFVSNLEGERETWPRLPMAPLDSFAESIAINGDVIDSAANNSGTMFQNPFIDTMANRYSVTRTIALRQHRRMRSNELHYIDHPLMGVLIKITPYELASPKITKALSGEGQLTASTAKEQPL